MMINLTNTMLVVSDLAASEAFYVEQLGLQVTARGEGWLRADGGPLSVILRQGSNTGLMIGFTAERLGAARTELAKKRVALSRVKAHPGGAHFNVTDPDGNVIMISNP